MHRAFLYFAAVLVLLVTSLVHTAAASTDAWQTDQPLTTPRVGAAVVAANGYIYAIGGLASYGTGGELASVEWAKINEDGSLSPWQTTSSLTAVRSFTTAVVVEPYIYVIGGQRVGQAALSSVERARILTDGSLGSWEPSSSLRFPRCNLAAVALQRQIFAIGGSNCTGTVYDSVERVTVNPDGTLGQWRTTASLGTPRQRLAVVQDGAAIYAVGGELGSALNTIEVAKLGTDGELISWQDAGAMQEARLWHSAVLIGPFLYAIGGGTATEGATEHVERGVLTSDGVVRWQTTPSLNEPRIIHGSAHWGNYIYTVGGQTALASPLQSVERLEVAFMQTYLPWSSR
jgi:N-acetylneuraminic acid mutarotase